MTSWRSPRLKTCILILSLLGTMVLAVPPGVAQQQNKPKPAAKAPLPKVLHGCRQCLTARAKPGKCAACGQGLAKVKAYICPQCVSLADQPGQCPTDKATLQRSEKFLAATAHVCPKCR